MAATKQSQCITLANDYLAMAQRLQQLYFDVRALNERYNSVNPSPVWAALPTAALNADGSLGAVDGTPVTSHPVNTGTVPTLARAVAQADLVTFVSHVQALEKYFDGAGAVAQVDRRPVIDPLVGG